MWPSINERARSRSLKARRSKGGVLCEFEAPQHFARAPMPVSVSVGEIPPCFYFNRAANKNRRHSKSRREWHLPNVTERWSKRFRQVGAWAEAVAAGSLTSKAVLVAPHGSIRIVMSS